jgi:hypothetical protein
LLNRVDLHFHSPVSAWIQRPIIDLCDLRREYVPASASYIPATPHSKGTKTVFGTYAKWGASLESMEAQRETQTVALPDNGRLKSWRWG